MEVRKYRGRTIAEAVNLVKRDLGPDALILSTKKLSSKRGASVNRGQMSFEISALEGSTHTEPKSGGLGQDYLQTLQSELVSIKEMIFLLNRCGHLMEGFRVNPGAIDLYARLIRSGISEPYAKSFLEKGGAFEENAQLCSDDVYRGVIKELYSVIDTTDPFKESNQQILAAFVGTTGVGKTTTIAKLAADLRLRQERTVGLISMDNCRIAAIEQLKTYASILGVPCFAVDCPANLQFALKVMKGKDVILVDTAGQSHYDIERIKEMGKLLGCDRSINSHLLLSAATNEVEMERAAKNFSCLDLSSYIFTKIDETKSRGVIINQLSKLAMPVSFVTTGQNVPEDILKATNKRILNLVFQ